MPPGVIDAVKLGFAATLGLGVAVAILWVTDVRRGADYVTPGSRGPSAAITAADFGPDALLAGETGYDGQQFYAVARFFPRLDEAAVHLDAPRYRLMRILAPALASLAPPGAATVAVLVGLNVVGVGMACGATAMLAVRRSWPVWIGLLAALPLLPAVTVTTVEPAAFGLGLVGVALADGRRHLAAGLTLTAGALTREAVAVMAVAVALGLALSGERRLRVLAPYGLSVLVLGGWYVGLGYIVGGSLPDRVDVLSFLSLGPATIALVGGVVALSLTGAWLWRLSPAAWPIALAFGVWTLFYFVRTYDWLALMRASAPSIILGIVAVAAWVATRARAT